MEGNLTKGPILKTLTKLAVPIMASSFLGTLYNITDMAWIGLLGSKAVARVGAGSTIVHKNSLRIDRVFIFNINLNGNLHSTGRFEDTIYSQFDRTCNKYDSRSITDFRTWSSE